MTKIRKWPTRALYIFVALALVLSLAGVLPGVGLEAEQALAEDGQPGPNDPQLLVYIERPADAHKFTVGEVFYVNAVVAYKDIAKSGTASKTVTATIDLGENAELVAGESASKSATIARNCLGDFWWKVRCTGDGDTTITVTAQTSELASGMDSVTVIQGAPTVGCELYIEPIQPGSDPHYVEVGDRYDVKVKLTNGSDKIATDVEVCIDIDPTTGAVLTGGDPHCWSVGDILPGRHVYVAWNLHCQDDSIVDITVSATAGNVIVCPPVHWTVHQGELPPEPDPQCYLDVVVHAPQEQCVFGCGYENFEVTATITNRCQDACTNVTAVISKPVGGDLASIYPPPIQDVGDIPAGESRNVTWNVTCTGEGDVTFRVVAQGDGQDCVGSGEATTEQKKILIDLLEPSSGETVYHNVGQSFNVTANITNCDCFPLENVVVELDLPDSVCIVLEENDVPKTQIWVTQYGAEGQLIGSYPMDPADMADPTKIPFTSFCACCIYTVEWRNLHCCETTPHAETAYIRVWDADRLRDEDYFYINQVEKAHLSTGVEVFTWTGNGYDPGQPIEPYPCDMGTTPVEAVAVGRDFLIVVPVMNMGGVTAYDVSVNLTITGDTNIAGNHTFHITEIPGRQARKIIIPAGCTGDGEVEIHVISVTGIDAGFVEPIEEDNLFPCGYRKIKQIPIEIEIVQPYDDDVFTCSDDFVVKVRVKNISQTEGNDLTGVTATIDWLGPAEFNPGAPSGYETKNLGDLEAGKEAWVVWNMHCTDSGPVYFEVWIESADPVLSDSRSIWVDQVGYADLNVEILSPMEGAWYGTGEEFAVTAKVWASSSQSGVEYVEGVEVTIGDYWYDWLWIEGDDTIYLGTMQVGYEHAKIVSWNVRAIKSGTQCNTWWDYVWVEASGPCLTPGYYGKYIASYPAANLVVDIIDAPEVVEVGGKFELTARVTNMGWADATGVKLTLSVKPPYTALPLTGYTEDIGTLIGYGQQGSKEVTWTLQFVPESWPPMADITITPSGYDECGWHRLVYYWGWYYEREANRPIADKFLHPDSAVVIQTDDVFVKSIAADPDEVTMGEGGTQQLAVTATYSDAATADVTGEADYASDNEGVATISATGLITALALGEATITVRYTEDGITGTAEVAVEVVDEMEISPIVIYYRDNHGDAGVCDIDSVLAIISDWLNDVTPTGFGQPPTIDDVLEMIGCWLAT